jgi:hypothetical protein
MRTKVVAAADSSSPGLSRPGQARAVPSWFKTLFLLNRESDSGVGQRHLSKTAKRNTPKKWRRIKGLCAPQNKSGKIVVVSIWSCWRRNDPRSYPRRLLWFVFSVGHLFPKVNGVYMLAKKKGPP